MPRTDDLRKIATRLRIHSLRMTTAAGSGHPTTCLSAADLAACLFFSVMRWNARDPNDPANDELVLSKGHAAPLLWAVYAEAGVVPLESLLDLRKISSALEGHPTPPVGPSGLSGTSFCTTTLPTLRLDTGTMPRASRSTRRNLYSELRCLGPQHHLTSAAGFPHTL